MSGSDNWYYALKGERNGPFTTEQMQGFVSSQAIGAETKIWSGVGDWVALKETGLAAFIVRSNEPPPLAATEVDNRFVWAVVAVPLIGAIIEVLLAKQLVWLYIALNISLCVLDERKLKAAGHSAPKSWYAAIVPVYLWKRASLLSQKKTYFYGWIGAFILSLGVSTLGNESNIEESACPVVTDIIKNQFRQSSKCIAVTIDETVKDGIYKAHATLDNGNDIDITIQTKKDHIYVTIPNQ